MLPDDAGIFDNGRVQTWNSDKARTDGPIDNVSISSAVRPSGVNFRGIAVEIETDGVGTGLNFRISVAAYRNKT